MELSSPSLLWFSVSLCCLTMEKPEGSWKCYSANKYFFIPSSMLANQRKMHRNHSRRSEFHKEKKIDVSRWRKLHVALLSYLITGMLKSFTRKLVKRVMYFLKLDHFANYFNQPRKPVATLWKAKFSILHLCEVNFFFESSEWMYCVACSELYHCR